MYTVIVGAARTAIGSFQGALSKFSAPELGSFTLREAITRSRVVFADVHEVIMGCALTAGIGQSPARQASLLAGIPKEAGALTVNKVCSSGLKAIMLADQAIRAGDADIVAAGGMESMSNAPYLLPKARGGLRLGDASLIDSLVYDGLRNATGGEHMGLLADNCAREWNISREEQDAFAVESYRRAQQAISEGRFREEVILGNPLLTETDEEPARVKFDKVATLKPVFTKEGTVTVANASSISDGAAAVVVMNEDEAKKRGVTPLARILAHAGASQDPAWYTTAPVRAIQNVLKKAKLTTNDIDLFEINEAFAVVTLVALRELKLDIHKVNVNGGAVALGHPIGASGARLVATLVYEMKRRNVKRGLVALCNGGGEATAMILER